MKRTSKSRKPGIVSILILSVNIVLVLALLLSYLSNHVSPSVNWALPFFGLIYPYLILLNFAFIVFWAVRRKWYFVISLVAILLGWNHLLRTYRFSGQDDFESGMKYFKLTSYNVKNLSNDNVDLVDKDVRNRIISYLNSTGSDLLCLQELMIIHQDPDAFIDSLSEAFGLPYHAYTPYSQKSKRNLDAIFIFSRFPIIGSGQLSFNNEYNYAVFTDIIADEDTFRLYNIHLESIRLRHEDYSFIAGFDLQFEKDENVKENFLRIFKKLKTAFAKRAGQVNNLIISIEKSPFPVILCGDFNDTPNSYAYHSLTRDLKDAFMESGKGFGNTYIGKVPSFRIDFILYDDLFHSREFSRGSVRFSDHYPISCYIGRNGQKQGNY